ncbi:unnamed protein product [Vitrella brassicaformis CCMP3155]|uniref:Proteasome subunit alpha type n=1 Tax=Vitrella brassicaformis (strain CCMP3155) TaxID=1169540 RepID=A0A0G4GLV1_VITBC|nr:unnamed protein product [Vitrella brassicaformis CCMP3155]|mmetsp:Transcript_26338/g.65484  ORF Transcript_26338/g.65484 Transcript_26338/m.65484 type:complete len:255 (+) Transcript_26338:58-822(+)|eukprot:CEM31098.1 unnamed protein product [Vitrella brassicaformis CCMP3155]
MYRNLYDTDPTTWSPQGRIHQIEYAMEAVKQGTCVVGLRSKTHVVLGALKKAQTQMSSHQQKLYKVDDHVGFAASGLTADARVLASYMRTQCQQEKYEFDEALPVGRLVADVGDRSQANTQRMGKRPYGVGLLVAGSDMTGPHLFETCPSGNYFEYEAMALGSRCQSAKTYLEKHFKTFKEVSVDDLIMHALKALKKASETADDEITAESVDIAIVGAEQKFKILSNEELQVYLDRLASEVTAAEGGEAPMDTT